MPIYDTSNVIDNSIFLKAKLDKNMVGSNYYIENLQEKRNRDWETRYNVVDIEEELNKQIEYTEHEPIYTPVESVITNVKSPTGIYLSDDWAQLSFKNLRHPCGVGYRYRFSLDFPDMSIMTEEEKHKNTSIWIGINKTTIKPGNSCIVRRCNTFLTLVGSPTKDKNYITEIKQEPCVLENEMRYMQIYYNQTVPVPQAEWYATVQLNYFTNFIKINDRFIFGVINPEDSSNNQVYKVKAVVKSTTNKTFVDTKQDQLKETDLLVLALDKDYISADDNFVQMIAEGAPIYQTIDTPPVYEYYIEMDDPHLDRILVGNEEKYTVNLYYNKEKVNDIKFSYYVFMPNIEETEYNKYFKFDSLENTFTIKNKKYCNTSTIHILVSCQNPTDFSQLVTQEYEVELGGFY